MSINVSIKESSSEEEIQTFTELSKEIQDKFAVLDTNVSTVSDKSQMMFDEYYKTKNKSLRERLVLLNQPLVNFIISKYYNNSSISELKDDLIQEDNMGLMSAVDGFDPTLGYKFSTYGAWWIRQTINSYLSNVEPGIKVPAHIRSAQNRLVKHLKIEGKTVSDIICSNDPDVTNREIPGFTKKMISSITSAYNAKFIHSLEQENDSDSDSNNHSSKQNLFDKGDSSEVLISKKEVTNMMTKALKTLTPEEKLILLIRFDVISSEDAVKHSENFIKPKKKSLKIKEEKEVKS